MPVHRTGPLTDPDEEGVVDLEPLRCARDPLLAPSALGAVARLGEMAIAALGEVLAKVSAGRALPARPRLLLALPEARPGFGKPEADAVVRQSGRQVSVETRTPLAVLQALVTWADVHGLELPDLEVRRPSLEDVYLELTEAPR